VNFRPELLRLLGEQRIAGRRIQELPQEALAHREFDVLRAGGETRKIESVSVEQHDGGIALADFVPLHAAVLEHEEGAAIVLQDISVLGEEGHALLRLALVVHEDSEHVPVRLPFADMHRELARLERDEAARLHDVAHEVGMNFGCPAPQVAQTLGRQIDADKGNPGRDDEGDQEERPEDEPGTHAGRIHHDQLGIVAELVQHVGDRDHQRDRGDDHDEQRNDQAGDADEHQDRLALIGHQIDVAQRLGDPHERRDAHENHQKRPERGAENVTPDRPHSRAQSPRSRLGRPDVRGPRCLRACPDGEPPQCSLSSSANKVASPRQSC
jgi:hypothetical protein